VIFRPSPLYSRGKSSLFSLNFNFLSLNLVADDENADTIFGIFGKKDYTCDTARHVSCKPLQLRRGKD
jgi:hypothetical protein